MKRGKNSNRNDDNEVSFQKRMKTFYTDTYQVLDYYSKKGKVLDVICLIFF